MDELQSIIQSGELAGDLEETHQEGEVTLSKSEVHDLIASAVEEHDSIQSFVLLEMASVKYSQEVRTVLAGQGSLTDSEGVTRNFVFEVNANKENHSFDYSEVEVVILPKEVSAAERQV